jgi:hypothetical protein
MPLAALAKSRSDECLRFLLFLLTALLSKPRNKARCTTTPAGLFRQTARYGERCFMLALGAPATVSNRQVSLFGDEVLFPERDFSILTTRTATSRGRRAGFRRAGGTCGMRKLLSESSGDDENQGRHGNPTRVALRGDASCLDSTAIHPTMKNLPRYEGLNVVPRGLLWKWVEDDPSKERKAISVTFGRGAVCLPALNIDYGENARWLALR